MVQTIWSAIYRGGDIQNVVTIVLPVFLFFQFNIFCVFWGDQSRPIKRLQFVTVDQNGSPC